MNICIVGTGAVGSTFAVALARAGHAITVVARGERLRRLQADGGVVTTADERVPCAVLPRLDVTVPYDLVLVTLLASQVSAVAEDLRTSQAKAILFCFNTFAPLDALRDGVGAHRFVMGFPSVIAHLDDGKVDGAFVSAGQLTTVSSSTWADVFNAAKIKTVTHPDLHAWLRSHAAWVVPLLALGVDVVARGGAGVGADDAGRYARAMRAGFDLVRLLGHDVTPGFAVALGALPTVALTPLLWAFSRSQACRDTGKLGPGEAHLLIDQMTTAGRDWPQLCAALEAIRPAR